MRRSSICLVVLLLSSFTIAQHHEAGSAPSAPAPSSAPVAAPSIPAPSIPSPPPSSPSPPAAPSYSAPSVSAVHSVPTPSTAESHMAPSATPVTSNAGSADRVAPTPRVSEPEAGRVTAAPKISGDEKISSAPRIGENTAGKDRDAKRSEPDLRHRVCEGAECKVHPPSPEPTETNLRHRVCPDGHCECPPGQTAGKAGCVVSQPSDQCLPGQAWNGASCAALTACPAGQVRIGASCEADCASVNGMTANLIMELRSARRQRDEACQQDPSSASCQQLDGHYHVTLSEYQNAWAGAPVNCRATLPVPDSL